MRVRIRLPQRPAFDAELIATFPANERPAPIWVRLYYGEGAPPGAFKAVRHARLIFRKENGGYVVMPDTMANKQYWIPIVEELE